MSSQESQYVSVIIIGGGQAGLSAAWCLRERGITDFLILEKNGVGHAWRSERWDSFALVTPNHQCRLPGYHYDGDDPEGFMARDEIVRFIEGYARELDPPLKEGVAVVSVTKGDGFFWINTTGGAWHCDDVIVAVGAYHTPVRPAGAERLPASIRQLHSAEYRNPAGIPEGEIVVVGSGQSGCQIMEDLHLAGRRVHLCLGNAPRSPRRYRGKDSVTWLEEMGYYDTTIENHPDQQKARLGTNHYLTGRDGGRDIDLRKFALEGVGLYGYVKKIEKDRFLLEKDVGRKLDAADRSYNGICQRIDDYIASEKIDAPAETHYQPIWSPREEPEELHFSRCQVTCVIWAIGFRPDFRFIELPVFDHRGYPETRRGVSVIPGLFFLGHPWQHTWGSARFSGIAADAEFVVDQILAS
ncbi:MAG: MSMEG_0569 family flavin-dependent oxidoreductase, partial [Verrucomicrobiota bacterium]